MRVLDIKCTIIEVNDKVISEELYFFSIHPFTH